MLLGIIAWQTSMLEWMFLGVAALEGVATILNWYITSVICFSNQGAKKIIFTAFHSGKLKLAFTSPDIISTSPKNFLTSRIDVTVLLLFEFLKKHYLLVGQVKNRIHQPDSKID